MSSTLSSLFITPLLAIISIPLIISAYLTVLFSLLALCIRLSLIYFDLCYAIISNFFIIPTSSDSLLTFTPSLPATPGTSTPVTPRRKVYPRPPQSRSRPSPQKRHSSYDGISGLVSGDRHRDFEDMGGWRFPADLQVRPSRYLSPSGSACTVPSAFSGIDDEAEAEADDRAWLSINQRLELPSPHLILRETDPNTNTANMSISEPALKPALPLSPSRLTGKNQTHHRRSRTTSILIPSRSRGGSGSGGLGLSLAQPESHTHTPAASTPETPGSGVAGWYWVPPSRPGSRDGAGYFSVGLSGQEEGSGLLTPKTGASGDEDLGGRWVMAHYPGSVRQRRRRRSVQGLQRMGG